MQKSKSAAKRAAIRVGRSTGRLDSSSLVMAVICVHMCCCVWSHAVLLGQSKVDRPGGICTCTREKDKIKMLISRGSRDGMGVGSQPQPR